METLLLYLSLHMLHTPEPFGNVRQYCQSCHANTWSQMLEKHFSWHLMFVILWMKVSGIALSRCWCSTAPGGWCHQAMELKESASVRHDTQKMPLFSHFKRMPTRSHSTVPRRFSAVNVMSSSNSTASCL